MGAIYSFLKAPSLGSLLQIVPNIAASANTTQRRPGFLSTAGRLKFHLYCIILSAFLYGLGIALVCGWCVLVSARSAYECLRQHIESQQGQQAPVAVMDGSEEFVDKGLYEDHLEEIGLEE